MNRDVTTDLFNILDLIAAAEDFGYDKSILMSAFGDITGPVSDEEIEGYIADQLSPGTPYDDGDGEAWRQALTKWRDRYAK